MILLIKYQGSMLCGFRQEDFFMFYLYKHHVKHMTPMEGHFGPKGHYLNSYILNILVVSDKKIFSYIPYISLCKTSYPWGGAIFGPMGIV